MSELRPGWSWSATSSARGTRRSASIVGKTPNLAARLQGIAEPNTVVICDTTRRLLGNLFELKDLGPRDLKGIARPAQAWAALRASSVASRFEALHATGLTALVGRDEESELLLRRWLRAKSGEGQVVLLSGEPGIGKSRLTAALLENLATEPHARLRFFCSPQHTDSALYPIIGQMERAAGLVPDDTPQARLDKLDAMLARTSTSVENAALFAEMLSLRERWTLSRARTDRGAAPAKNAGRVHFANASPDTLQSGADDLRGCALERPHEPGSARSGGGPDRDPSRAADRDVPAGIRSALDRTASRDCAHHQSTGAARSRRP